MGRGSQEVTVQWWSEGETAWGSHEFVGVSEMGNYHGTDVSCIYVSPLMWVVIDLDQKSFARGGGTSVRGS